MLPSKAVVKVVEGATQFACRLYSQIAGSTSGNIFFSPSSIGTALAMTYAGAADRTAEEMATTLGLQLPDEELHAAAKSLHDGIRPAGFELRVANRLWGQTGYNFLPRFTQTIERFYDAPIRQVDFRGSPEQACREINQWVEEQTANRVKDLVSPGQFDPLTRLVLVNAIHFLGRWVSEFDEESTHDAPFWVGSHDQRPVRMMRQRDWFAYRDFDDLQVLEMPYISKAHRILDDKTDSGHPTHVTEGDGSLVMTVLLPRQIDGLAEVEACLTPKNLAQWTKLLRPRFLDLHLPKFGIDCTLGLNEVLQRMGMRRGFSVEDADFSRMSDDAEGLFLAAVIHKAFVRVDEEGTEAAAATAVMMLGAAEPPEPVTFKADHPFLFLIRDRETRSVLFCGRVAEPSERV